MGNSPAGRADARRRSRFRSSRSAGRSSSHVRSTRSVSHEGEGVHVRLGTYFFGVERRADLQAFVAVLLAVVLRHGLLKDARGDFRVAMVANGDVEADRAHVVGGNFEYVRVVEADDEAFVFDVGLDGPRLLIFIEERDGNGIGGERIDDDGEDS